MKFRVLIAIFSILLSPNSWAVSDKDITNSVLKHYPLILSGYDKVEAARGGLQASRGAFDIKLKQEFLDYSRGYYDGKYSETTIERQNRLLGSKVYGGYRRSYRDFESYTGGVNTAHNGEFFASINIPLLQGRAIDQNRLGEMLANYDFEESKIYLEKIKIQIQQDALKAYWNWIGAVKSYKIYADLYKLSLTRDEQLRQKFKHGDIAEIIVIENKKNLLTRKNDMIRAETELQNSAIYLSLFYRDENSNP
ncbi:MAG: TolC family protein, partial [Rickettsiales bacterium]|nr:TolC family protein [Rickettsiales bacterium]